MGSPPSGGDQTGAGDSRSGEEGPKFGLYKISVSGRPGEEIPTHSRDVPSYVYYGVDTREVVAFRLVGDPRAAALALARSFGEG